MGIVQVALGHCRDGQLRHLLGGFITLFAPHPSASPGFEWRGRVGAKGKIDLDPGLFGPTDIEDYGVGGQFVVELCVVSVADTTAIEATQANIQAFRSVLLEHDVNSPSLGWLRWDGEILTMLSKHWVQSSRWTLWVALGG